MPDWVDCSPHATHVLGTTDTTAQVHPLQFVHALLEVAGKKTCGRTKVHIGTVGGLVLSELPDGALSVKGVVVDGQEQEFDHVILAAGPWSQYVPDWCITGSQTEANSLDLLRQIGGERYHSVTMKAKVML